jgi:Ni/Co efflux regulator RcnB
VEKGSILHFELPGSKITEKWRRDQYYTELSGSKITEKWRRDQYYTLSYLKLKYCRRG